MINIFTDLLNFIFSFTKDYGLSIVLLTLTVKLVLLPITLKTKKSMAKQQSLSKEIKSLKEKYTKDKERLQTEIMELYKKNKVNPLGFLLIFAQMPVLFVMYRVFSNNIIQSGTSILPWISSLAHPDPYFVLPVMYVIIQLLPSIIGYFDLIKGISAPKLTVQTFIMPIVISILLVIKAPAALGIYFISSALFTSIEQLIPLKKNLNQAG